uniref:C-type lectin domain-containing protein n=1 Tax=Monopterus albus TaxID=43700 RepID=A0A3Q3KH59_MONAL
MAGEFLFHQYWLMNLFCSCYSIQHHRRRLAFYKLGNDSYKLVAQKMRWDEARRQCKADDADLASILNPITQAYITLRISKHNEPVWIGLNSNTGGRFKWVDNWLLSYTKWGRDEPKNNYGCVYIDVDRTWKTAPCTNNYYSLCKRSPGETRSEAQTI